MPWRPYAACCHREALATDAAFCAECGRRLIRCMAFSECMSLVTPTQPCPVCVAPQLSLDENATTQSKVGERLSIPLILRNASKVERPIAVTGIVKVAGRAHEPIDLPWEQIDSGAERRFSIETESLTQGGAHALGLIATLATRYKGREEQYAFAASVKIAVETQEQQNIVQNINLAGAQFETGGMVHAPVSSRITTTAAPVLARERRALPLERAERYEIERGLRGYGEGGLRAPRDVAFRFTGFANGDAPENGAGFGVGGALSFGRNSRRFNAESNPYPNDVRLIVTDARTGAVDEDATRAISRHQFDLLVLNDRLCAQARATSGVELNGRKLASGEIGIVRHGDRIAPLAAQPGKLALTVRLRGATGVVEEIEIAREPGPR